jgi:hypothetical protein
MVPQLNTPRARHSEDSMQGQPAAIYLYIPDLLVASEPQYITITLVCGKAATTLADPIEYLTNLSMPSYCVIRHRVTHM